MVDIVDDSLFGTDFNSTGELASNGDIGLISGLSNAKQNILNWLRTEKGTYPSVDSEYGSLIMDSLGEDTTQTTIQSVTLDIQNALYQNPRVQNIVDITPYVTVDDRLYMQVQVELVNGQNTSFTLDIIGE